MNAKDCISELNKSGFKQQVYLLWITKRTVENEGKLVNVDVTTKLYAFSTREKRLAFQEEFNRRTHVSHVLSLQRGDYTIDPDINDLHID